MNHLAVAVAVTTCVSSGVVILPYLGYEDLVWSGPTLLPYAAGCWVLDLPSS